MLPVTGQSRRISDVYARFKHLTSSDGLPSNRITALFQDNERYVWIGTDKGLSRYDGNHFMNFFQNSSDPASLPGNFVMCIKQDSIGNIWVGTKSGLAYYDKSTARFVRIPLISETGKGLSSNSIRYVLPDKYPYVWVETEDGNLHYLNSNTFRSEIFPHIRITQPYYNYHSIFKDSYDRVWVGGRNLGPGYLDIDTKKYTFIPVDPENPEKKRDNDVACYFEDSKKRFWVSGTDGFYLYDRIRDIFTKKLATSTFQIAEDQEKNLWLATGGGLYKYQPDKGLFTRFAHNESDPASISSDHQYCLLIDSEGNIWTGTAKGVNILLKQQTLIRHYRHIPSIEGSLNNNNVTSFFELNDSVIYIGTNGGGINVLNKNTETFVHYTTSTNLKCPISANNVSVIKGNNEHLWAGLWRGVGFNRFDIKDKCFTRFAINKNSLKVDWYSDFYDDGSDTLWCGIWGGSGIHFFDKKSGRFLDKNYEPFYHPDNTPVFNQVINGNFLITSGTRGYLHIFDNRTKKFSGYTSLKNKRFAKIRKLKTCDIPKGIYLNDGITTGKNSILATNKGLIIFSAEDTSFVSVKNVSRACYAITKSKERHSFWLATERGLEYFDLTKKKSFVVEKNSGKNSPLYENPVSSLVLYDRGHLLLGTSKGLLIYDPVLSRFIHPEKERKDSVIFSSPIKKIKLLPGNRTGFILKQGFAVASPSLDTVNIYNVANSFRMRMPTDIIYDILPLKNEKTLLLATDMGIILFDEQKSVFTITDKFRDYTVHSLKYSENKISACTDKGYLQYIPAADSLIPYNIPPSDKLTSHLISFLHKDRDGYVWAGTTNRGVNRIDPDNDFIHHYFQGNHKGFGGSDALCFLEASTGDIYIGGEKLNQYDKAHDRFFTPGFASGLPDEDIVALLEDNTQKIWIITESSIFKYDKTTDTLKDISKLTGLNDLSFTKGVLKERSGKFLIGTDHGFLSFIPENLKEHILSIPVHITGISVFGKDIPVKNISKGIELNYDENFPVIKYSSMCFSPVTVTYEYMLKGVDQNWVKTTKPSTSYTKIQPGRYIFMIRNADLPDKTAAAFPIYIKPPFWQTWWFKTAIILILALLVFFWWKQRLNKLRVLENNLRLWQRLLLSQLNPHFIFNILTAIQSFIYQNNPQESGRYLSKFAKLMRLVLENMRSEFTPVEKEKDTLTYYLEMQRLRFNNSFDFEISVTGIDANSSMALPTMILQPLVENAVEHGMRKIKEGGLIRVEIKFNNHDWEITVEDNGPGIQNMIKEQLETAKRKKHRSLSSIILKERIEAFNKKERTKRYYIKYQNLTDEDGKVTGMRITLRLPATEPEQTSDNEQ